MFWPCETRTSTCRSFATISSGLYRFLAIAVLLDFKDIPQVGPLQWGGDHPCCARTPSIGFVTIEGFVTGFVTSSTPKSHPPQCLSPHNRQRGASIPSPQNG